MKKLIQTLVCLGVFGSPVLAAPCTQTVSVGANLSSLASSVSNGSVICLNTGDYGSVNFTNLTSRTGFVTFQSATGKGAIINPIVNNSTYIKFDSLTVRGASIDNCAKNIEIRNSDFTDSLGINNYNGNTCTNYPANIVIDGNNVPEVGPAFSEGRIDIRDKDGVRPDWGVTVSNNYISGGCLSDGVQISGAASGVLITGNHFDNIIQVGGPEPKPHCDGVQIYGSGNNNRIIGNWFRNCSSVLQNAEASANTILRNNVFQNGDNSFNSDFGGTMMIEHNTIYSHNTIFRVGPNATAVIRNNLFVPGPVDGFHTETCDGCTISNNPSGSPVFVGGSNPNNFNSFSDWELATGSFGKGAGTDGKDIGVLVSEVPSPGPQCDYPSQQLNLTNWKETLPTGASESPTEITQPALATFTVDPWFKVNSACEGVQFRAPVNGVTTSGSGYPRSELREMASNGSVNASWSAVTGVHTMLIDQAIMAVPQTKPHVVASQIHDANDDVIVVRLENQKLFVDVNGTEGPTLDSNYTLGKRFNVKFVGENGQIKIYYNGGSSPAHTIDHTAGGNYFKAGVYTQANCTNSSPCAATNFGEVHIYDLWIDHQTETTPPAGWQNTAFTNQTGIFQASFDMVPNQAPMDGVTGMSIGAADAYTDLAVIIKFAPDNEGGVINARNGGVYQAVNTLTYSAGTTYHVNLNVNIPNKTYSATVTPQGGAPVLIASNYAFRSEQSGVSQLNNRVAYDGSGTHTVSNFLIGSNQVSHPADTGPGGTPNSKIEPDEATTFGACWKSNCKPEATLNNAVRAGTLWNASANGEYEYNLNAGACPLCWIVVAP